MVYKVFANNGRCNINLSSIMKKTEKEILENRIERKKVALQKAKDRSQQTFNNLGWGSGMRRTKLVSYAREDNLQYELESLLKQYSQL